MPWLTRRVLGYHVDTWRDQGKWYCWIETPQGVHIFCNAFTLGALESLYIGVIQDHIAQKGA